jgi:hypothetical protein
MTVNDPRKSVARRDRMTDGPRPNDCGKLPLYRSYPQARPNDRAEGGL